MDKNKLIDVINEIDILGTKVSIKAFECGAHTNIETQRAMRQSNSEFSDAISNLREIILTEGVEE